MGRTPENVNAHELYQELFRDKFIEWRFGVGFLGEVGERQSESLSGVLDNKDG